ncbi:type 1 glutamine amidotransferase [Sphingomonas mollis]|uniref:Type 1 glutamine amidotransferase n=1 Tax=Sphingomonas mollis TaxID=2795726 RepID=A0ABS0XSN3_9SPHN|nr:type 1 glutamine amidotransferase [Sphingomonas sp. BT553]MBJ6123054.1 type 1 glutamine amidotransferase [Sphingomonas sp. BT553]
MPTSNPLRLLVVESETPQEREERRASAGRSAGESYAATLVQLMPGCTIDRVTPSDADHAPMRPDTLAGYDAVFLSGSPIQVWEDQPETRRQLDFMRAVYASGTPAFGSCAGLQVAVAAAGGTVRKMPHRQEAGLARRLTATPAGRNHPMLAARPAVWDAPAIHGDEVETLPEGATLLAGNAAVRVQAVEIRHGEEGIFWGVQYHPELAPGEIGAALRRQADGLIEDGLARDGDDVEAQAALFDALHDAPDDHALWWRLGIDAQVAEEPRRRTELIAFIEHLVLPTWQRRRGPAEIAA